ncbi:hypothetical protein GCM10009679_25790 [Saccharothrix algeriensis]
MGRAGSPGARGATERIAPSAGPVDDSTTEPHSPHSGQRPTHFGGWCPQASHSYAGRAGLADLEVVLRTVTRATYREGAT